MAVTVAELQAIIGVNTQPFESGMGRVQSGLQGLGSSFGGLGNAITNLGPLAAGSLVAVAGAVGFIAKSAFDAAVAFDAASDRIRIATGATGAELARLEGSFKTVFTSVPASADDAAKAIAFLSARLGTTGEELEKLATTELELARITGSALAPQLEATTRLFKDWEIATGTQTTALDFLFKASQKTGIGVTDLSQKMVQFGAPLRQLGFSFEEAAVLIGKFQAEGVELNKALPGLRIALSKMAKEGVRDAGDAFQFLVEKIQNAKTPLAATQTAIELFGRRAGPDMAEAIKQGRFSIEELQKTIHASSDTILKAAKDTEDFAEKWIILKNKASEALLPLGNMIFTTLTLAASIFLDTEAEIEKNWIAFWDSMKDETGKGLGEIIEVMIINGDPVQEAGAHLGRKFRSGFIKYFNEVKEWWGGRGFNQGEVVFSDNPAEMRRNEQPFTPAGPNPFKGLAEENLKITAAMKAHNSETRRLTGSYDGLTGATKKAGGALRETTKIVSEQEKQFKGLQDAMRSVVEGINKVFRDAAIDKILVEKIAPAVTLLKERIIELRGEFVVAVPAAHAFSNALGTIPHVQLAGGINVLAAKLAQLVEEENLAALASQRLHDQMVADVGDSSLEDSIK